MDLRATYPLREPEALPKLDDFNLLMVVAGISALPLSSSSSSIDLTCAAASCSQSPGRWRVSEESAAGVRNRRCPG